NAHNMYQEESATETHFDDQSLLEEIFPNVSSPIQSRSTPSQGDVQTPGLRRSNRQTKFPVKFND
ncbi:hypothetical protein Tco_1171452, partial [Tanacetum coccineum]